MKKLTLLTFILFFSISLNANSKDNFSALGPAKNKNISALIRVLESGADPNISDVDGNTPLFYAVADRDVPMINVLLYYKANVNIFSKNGMTPIIVASHSGNEEIINLLHKNGAKLNVISHDGNTALSRASSQCHLGAVNLLHKLGASITANNDKALFNASYYGCNEVLKYLIENGAKVSSKNKDGVTPILESISNGKIDTIKLLLSYGADIKSKNNNGKDAFYYAALNIDKISDEKLLELYNLLISNDVDINAKTGYKNRTPLHELVSDNKLDLIRLLLLKKSNPNIKDLNGDTCLHESIHQVLNNEKFSLDILDILLEYKADFFIKNNEQKSPFDLAILFGNYNILNKMLENGADPNYKFLSSSKKESYPLLIELTILNEPDLVELVIKYGANIHSKRKDGDTALEIAKNLNYKEIINILLKNGAKY